MAISKIILNGTTQMDVTDTTATAADVAQGKVFYAASGERTVGTASGGAVERSDVNFYDYDGTLLHAYTIAQINDSGFTMPSNPSHTGLTAQGWNWTLAEIKAQLTAVPNSTVNVGQMYVTDDGKTRIYVSMHEGRLHPYLGIGINGTVVVDWGDSSATDTMTGEGLTDTVYQDHQYASGGDYVITLTVTSGSFQFYGNYSILSSNGALMSESVYTDAVKKVEIGNNTGIGFSAFSYCNSLTTITLPSWIRFSDEYIFEYCHSLQSITIPSGVTEITDTMFQSCGSLSIVSIPSSVTTISNYAFSQCTSLISFTFPSGCEIYYGAFQESYIREPVVISTETINESAFYACGVVPSVTLLGTQTIMYSAFYGCPIQSLTLPDGLTEIQSDAFNRCFSLASLTIPSSVTTIGGMAFAECYGLGEIHFKPTTPPTLDSYVFDLAYDCKIYVPTGSLSAYTSASNYPDPSNYTYIEE